MAHDPEAEVKPYVPPEQSPPEFTWKAIILGSVFAIIFGAATVYLALKAGLTVSASIPVAVLAIAVFKKIGKSTILENNIVQTIASAGESIAAGVVFTIPALLFLPGGDQYFRYLTIMTLAAVGGILGVLFMVPLRRSLIVKEHKNLPYPEGTACADVLIVGEKGGNLAKKVFAGVYTALVYKLGMSILGLWKDVPTFQTGPKSAYPNATLNSEITPEYLGVGYIIGPRISPRCSPAASSRGWCSSRSSPSSSPRRSASPTCTPSASPTAGSPATVRPSRSTARTSATSAPAPSPVPAS
jgi:putative OPT family oligopeptide transporter